MRAILTWHSIDASGSPISVSREEFGRQVEWLASGRVPVVGLEQLLALPEGAPAVALTFDDGFASFASEAAPLLRRHQLPVTLFVVTEQVGLDNRWEGRSEPGIPVLPLLDWDSLGRLAEQGVRLGGHTRRHRRLTRMGAAELEDELGGSAEAIARRVGTRPSSFAYPYGAVDAASAAAAARWYDHACTTELRALRPSDNRHRLPRLDAWYLRQPRRLAAFGTAGFRTWVWARRQARRLRAH